MLRPGLLIALLLAAAAALAWVLLGEDASSQRAPASRSTAEEEQDRPSTSAALSGADSKSSESDDSTSAKSRRTLAGGHAPADATVVVHVVRSDTGSPVAGQQIVLQRSSGGRSESQDSELRGQALLTDELGVCRFGLPAGVRARAVPLLALRDPAAGVEVGPLEGGETSERTIVMPMQDLWVRVESEADRGPIAGALVEVRTGRHSDGGQQVVTGTGGLALLSRSAWGGESAAVVAPGYVSAVFTLPPGHEEPEEALVIRLARGACLRGRVVEGTNGGTRGGGPIQGAFVRIRVADVLPRMLSTLRGPDASAGTPQPFGTQDWETLTDARGAFALCDLPTSVTLRVDVHKGMLTLEPSPELRLEPGVDLDVVYKLGGGAVVRGVALDESDLPLIGCEIWLDAPGELNAFGKPMRRARSDAGGRFELKDVPSGTFDVAPAPDSGYLPAALAVRVPEGVSLVETVLRAQPALFTSGRVLAPDGKPAAGAIVSSDRGPSCMSESDGAFRIGPFAAGDVTLDALTFAGHTLAEPVVVPAGAENVVLRLGVGFRITGRIIDAATGAPCSATISWGLAERDTKNASTARLRSRLVDPSGEFLITGLKPGIYGLSARTPEGRVGMLDGIAVSEANGGQHDLVLPIAPGGRLSIRFPRSGEPCTYRVRAGELALVQGAVNAEGAVLTPQLPPGELTVELIGPGGTVLLYGAAQVRAGETSVADLSR